jgi:hypothetical protein
LAMLQLSCMGIAGGAAGQQPDTHTGGLVAGGGAVLDRVAVGSW